MFSSAPEQLHGNWESRLQPSIRPSARPSRPITIRNASDPETGALLDTRGSEPWTLLPMLQSCCRGLNVTLESLLSPRRTWGISPSLGLLESPMVPRICFWVWSKFFFLFCFWATPCDAQGLLLAQQSGMTLGGAWGPCGILGTKPVLATCKAGSLPTVLFIIFLNKLSQWCQGP